MNTMQTTAPTPVPAAARGARLGSLAAAALVTVAMLGGIDVLSVPAAASGLLVQAVHAPAA